MRSARLGREKVPALLHPFESLGMNNADWSYLQTAWAQFESRRRREETVLTLRV